MSTKRKFEYFSEGVLKHQSVISNSPIKLYHQERDWTCSIACIRTILSSVTENVPSEDYYVENYNMIPGPYYSKDIKKMDLLHDLDAVYGCDKKDFTFDEILELSENKYFIMLESMINYAHWLVLLGYYPLTDGDIENSKILLYDPYYDNVRLVNTDEFIGMWIDGNYAETKVSNDFIAVKRK